MVGASFSVGYSKKTQSKASIGKEMVGFFLNNHLLYIWTCIVIWMAMLYNNLYLMYMNSIQFVDPIKFVVNSGDIEDLVGRTSFSWWVF
jgi:hypothetical protein